MISSDPAVGRRASGALGWGLPAAVAVALTGQFWLAILHVTANPGAGWGWLMTSWLRDAVR